MSALNLLGRIVLAGVNLANEQNRNAVARTEEEKYWDGRLTIVLEGIQNLQDIPIRTFGSFPDQRSIDRKNAERTQTCNELRLSARRACLEKSKSSMDRVERDLKSAVFFAS